MKEALGLLMGMALGWIVADAVLFLRAEWRARKWRAAANRKQ